MKQPSNRFSLFLALALIAWTATYLFWIFTANVNWDEFALLAHSHDAVRTGALASGGKTIAVMGSGLERIYPAENAKLFHRISENGAVV